MTSSSSKLSWRTKNFLFVGDEAHGANLAGLYSLVATCDAVGIDPVEYIKDVLMRVDTHPSSRVDELLPQNWAPLQPYLARSPGAG
jgi:transposase